MGSPRLNTRPISRLLAEGVGQSGVAQVLRTVRKHLGMDVAFVSRFRETDRVLEHVDADGVAPIHEGQAVPVADGYCLKVVRGELPALITDTSAVPEAMAIPATHAIPIGAHLGVPIELSDGVVYGTLCCFSREPNLTLGERDLRLMRALGEILAARIDEEQELERLKRRARQEIRKAVELGGPRIVYQPIYALSDGAMVGALAKGLIAFAREVGSRITAEGVETEAELATLRAIGVDKAQGYFLSKPRALEDLTEPAGSSGAAFARAAG